MELAGAEVTSVEGLAVASLFVLLLRAATAARRTVDSPLLLRATAAETIVDKIPSEQLCLHEVLATDKTYKHLVSQSMYHGKPITQLQSTT